MGGLFRTDYPPYPLWFCKKYEDPFGSPGAKPLAEAKRQKERSPKERSDHISGTIGIFLVLGTYRLED